MSAILASLRNRLFTTDRIDTHMSVHTLTDAEFDMRGMKRADVARMIMMNSAW